MRVRAFDSLEEIWDARPTRRVMSRILIAAFVGSVILIELSRQGVITSIAGHPLPTNHLKAISWVVTILLVAELFDLVFALAGSVARAMGKQLEVYSLVLLRKTFDELPKFEEPITTAGHEDALLRMAALVAGSFVVFVVLIGYYRLQKHEPLSDDRDDVASFVVAKKIVCLLLLASLVVIGGIAGLNSLTLDHPDDTLSLRFFELFYTILIFADILIVLASLGATQGYRLVYRNFAFAAVTVFIRLALAAEPIWNSAIGSAAALLALGVSFAHMKARPVVQASD